MGLPIPNLDDKTFDEFVEETRSLIARFAPEWTDYNIHDPGITFIELFAWLAEMQIYRLNWVTDQNYAKFLKLVGVFPSDSQPARVQITFENVNGEERQTIEAGTQVITEVDTKRIVFETEDDLIPAPVAIKVIKTLHDSQSFDHTQANERDDMHFAPFGEKAPKGAVLLLGFDRAFQEKEIHMTFFLFEENRSAMGNHEDELTPFFPSPKLTWEYLNGGRWSPLSIIKDTTRALTRSGRIVFDGPLFMQKKEDHYWIRCRLEERCYEIPPLMNRILLNTIPAVQIETIQEEVLRIGSERPEQKIFLKKAPIIRGSQKIQVQEDDGGHVWKEVEDFESSGPDDRHYKFDPENGEITFGNGLNGRIPLPSQEEMKASYEMRASYKTTLGAQGNISKGHTFEATAYGLTAINPEAATGGKAAESIEEAKIRARKNFLIPSRRAITADDYEKLALATPGLRVARAQAIPHYDPNYAHIPIPGAVTVVVVPHATEETGNPVPEVGFLQTILKYLNMHRLVTTEVHVIGPEYVKIAVTCQIHLKKRSGSIEVENRVQERLKEFLDPLKGGSDQQGWPFGRPVFSSEIYQIIDKVEGVDYVTDVSLSGKGKYQKGSDNSIEIPRFGLVYSGDHQVVSL